MPTADGCRRHALFGLVECKSRTTEAESSDHDLCSARFFFLRDNAIRVSDSQRDGQGAGGWGLGELSFRLVAPIVVKSLRYY